MGYNSGKIKVESSAKKKTNPFGKDVVVDPEGQWKFPGQVVKIPSGNITMKGIPYPVYGTDELGNGQMMYPEMNYQFPGNMVTEYPMMQKGGTPKDYKDFLKYSETAPENRRPDASYEYGNPRQYDHYGMWDALGKPKDFAQALKMNPHWQPDPYDNMYHGYSVNPNTGVWLKPHIPGEHEPGSTAFMEYSYYHLNPDLYNNFSVVYDPELQRMKGVPRRQIGGELELTDEEVEQYRKGGFVVEELPKAQVGYNTPEYNEAYNQGTVTRYNPETDTYQAPNLPEFEVRPRSFMDEMDQIGHTAMNFLGELTPIPSAFRIIDDPVGTAKGTAQTVADLAMYSNPSSAILTQVSDINPITGQPYWQGVDQALDVATVVPELGAAAKALKLGKHAKNVGRAFRDIGDYAVTNYVHPITKAKTIREIENLNKGLIERYSTPEMRRRLQTIGLNPEELTLPELTWSGGSGSHYSPLDNKINIDLPQLSRLRKQRKLTNSDVATYEHEVGHWLQKQAVEHSPVYKRQLEKYNYLKDAWDAKQKRIKSGYPNIGEYETLPPAPPIKPFGAQRTIYDELLTRKPLTDLPGALPGQILPYEAVSGANPQLSRAYDNWDYFNYRGANKSLEPLAHAREMRQTMIEQGYLKNLEDKITDEKLMEFIEKNPTDRISSFIAKRPAEIRRLKQVINNAPVVVPGAVGAGVLLNQERDGGEIIELTDEEVEKYKKGGYVIEEYQDGGTKYNTPEYRKAYEQGTVTRYNPETDTYQGVDLPEFTVTPQKHFSGVPLPTQEQMAIQQGLLKQYNKQPFWDKTYDILSHPMTAITQSRGGLADNIGTAIKTGNLDRNPLDMAVDAINPVAYVNMLRDIKSSANQGDYGSAAIMSAGALPFIPNVKHFYRGLSKAGYEDALKHGVFRQAQTSKEMPGLPKHKGVYYGTGDKGFDTATVYDSDYIVELTEDAFTKPPTSTGFLPGRQVVATGEHIPISKGRILKKDKSGNYVEVSNKQKLSEEDAKNISDKLGFDVNDFLQEKEYGGEIMELTDAEVAELKKQGYKIENV